MLEISLSLVATSIRLHVCLQIYTGYEFVLRPRLRSLILCNWRAQGRFSIFLTRSQSDHALE